MILGDAFVASINIFGVPTCTFKIVGLSGLTDNTQIAGSNLHDQIFVLPSTANVCGFTMTPIVRNGFSLRVMGNGENDFVHGGNHAIASGGDRNDIVISNLSNSVVEGNGGEDTVMSSNSTTRLRGHLSDDALCVSAPAVHVQELNGGGGIDTRCGAAHEIIDVEGLDCDLCDL
jgi:hypothetical protein